MFISQHVILSAQLHQFLLSTSILQSDFNHVLEDRGMVHKTDSYFFPSTTDFQIYLEKHIRATSKN